MHMLYEHTNILTSSLEDLKKSKKYPHLFKLLGKQISKKKKPTTVEHETCINMSGSGRYSRVSLTEPGG